ncbi:response regulator transcription factor [Eudoraea sp.]|uniref:response regulator transcription factor n=1 Tax=Eudoraea sp. TaxID=1979955 RepID=UPI003C755845
MDEHENFYTTSSRILVLTTLFLFVFLIQSCNQAPKEAEKEPIVEVKEIILMLNKGLRNKEIAEIIFVAEGTVKKHIYNICQKWNVNSRIELLKIAREFGLIEVN